MKRIIFISILLACTTVRQADACLWHRDTDTLEKEGKGVPDVVNTIVGRFERNPPLYYQMRLDRVSKEIEQKPDELSLYDDAGVASDRLGKIDEAIAWMEKKLARIEKLQAAQGETPELKRHRYRYCANQGTFYGDRWFHSGANRADMADMQKGRDLIAEGIKINPEAHFGRERYQIMFVDWLLLPGPLKTDESVTFLRSEKYGAPYRGGEAPPGYSVKGAGRRELEDAGLADATNGAAGLIALGNAWELPDVYHALSFALFMKGDTWVAYLGQLRTRELIKQGGKLLRADELRDGDSGFFYIPPIDPDDEPKLRLYAKKFEELRVAADEWHRKRTEYMMERLTKGRHPDTDPTFWAEYKEDPAPSLVVKPKPKAKSKSASKSASKTKSVSKPASKTAK